MENRSNPMASDGHLREPVDVAQAHGVELHLGLHDDELARRADVNGPNELMERGRHSRWQKLLEKFPTS